MTADTWQAKAAELIADEHVYTDSNLRGMIEVAREHGDVDFEALYRAELARRRARRKQGDS